MKRAALYVRVSTQEQKNHGLSVDNQIDALKQYCIDNNLTEVGLYNDAGISARKKYTKRPALLELIADCQAGKIDIILFTKLDRWFRSVADYYEVQTQLDAASVPWRAIWEDYETETSSGVFKVNIMLSVAQSEADRTSERVKSVMEYRRAQGKFTGTAPTGYVQKNSQLYKDEAIEDTITKIFEHYAACLSVDDTIEYAHGLGFLLTRATFRRMLLNETYTGLASGFHKCEPYITQEQYKINIKSIEGRRHKKCKVSNKPRIFKGLIKCAYCGHTFGSVNTPYIKKDGTRVEYTSYRCLGRVNCKCTNTYTISEHTLEWYLLNSIDTEMSLYRDEAKLNALAVENSEKIKALEAKLKRVGIRFEDGDIEVDEYRSKRAGLLAQIDELKSQAPETIPEPLPEGWKDIYNTLDEQHKQAFWASTIDHVIVGKKGQPINIVF